LSSVKSYQRSNSSIIPSQIIGWIADEKQISGNIAPDIFFNLGIGLKSSEMTFAENIGFEGEQEAEARLILVAVSAERGMNRSVDILAKENPSPFSVPVALAETHAKKRERPF